MTDITHDALVSLAARWLRSRGHTVVATEVVSGRETADAIGWKGTHSTLIECKTSRSDFLADGKKFFRRHPERGMGSVRYYLAPKGLIDIRELPARWGLIEVVDGRTRVKYQSSGMAQERDAREEIATLLSCIRRIGNGMDAACSVKAYTYETQATATLGVEVLDASAAGDRE